MLISFKENEEFFEPFYRFWEPTWSLKATATQHDAVLLTKDEKIRQEYSLAYWD